jgi:tetratricopeptide (TPR) repeat protein
LPRLGFMPAQEAEAESETAPYPLTSRLTADAIAWFNAERLNLLAVAVWACTHGQHRLATRLASCQLTYQYLQHQIDDGEYMWRAIAEASNRVSDVATSSQARFHLAWMLAERGRFADAYAALEKCVPLLEARRVHGTHAVALYWRAFCAQHLGLYGAERDDAERCLSLARQLGEPGIEVMALRLLGIALTELGSRERGIALCEQATAIARDHHEPVWEYYALTSLAFALSLTQRYRIAESRCREGIEVSRRLGLLVTGEAYLLGMLGDSYAGQGRYQESIDVLSKSMVLFQRYGDRHGQAFCLLKLGQAWLALGESERADAFLRECLPIFQELRLPAYEEATVRLLQECHPVQARS